MANAPAEVVVAEREKQAEAKRKQEKLTRNLENLG